MSSTRVLRHSWTLALVILLVTGWAVPAQTKPPVALAAEAVAVSERHDLSGLSDAVDAREHIVARLGILGLNLTDQIRQILPAVRVATGGVIASTVVGAIDSRDGGFAPGDVIYAINRVPVSGLNELRALLETLRLGDPVVVQLERRGELMYRAFTLE